MLKTALAATSLVALCAQASSLAQAQDTKSKNPPEGPPWTQDFFEARETALASGKPIFLYSTKTY